MTESLQDQNYCYINTLDLNSPFDIPVVSSEIPSQIEGQGSLHQVFGVLYSLLRMTLMIGVLLESNSQKPLVLVKLVY